MIKRFVRNENHEIIGTKIELEHNERLEYFLNLESKYNHCENSIKLINHSLTGKNSRKTKIYFLNKLKEFELEKAEINKQLEKLKTISTYDMFELTNLHVGSKESLEFTPIISEEKKVKQKKLNEAYNLQRKMQRNNVMITLDKNDYR